MTFLNVDWGLFVDRFALAFFILVCVLAAIAAVYPDVLLDELAKLANTGGLR